LKTSPFNALKHRGYNLEHNFGHGHKHAAEIFCLLNFLSFLTHGLQDLADEDCQKARASFGRRDEFFGALRYETRQYPHNDWHELLTFIAEGSPDGELRIAVHPPAPIDGFSVSGHNRSGEQGQ
jgi:hypothetical protein